MEMNKKTVLQLILAIILISIALFFILIRMPIGDFYEFVLENETYPEIDSCGLWNYENVTLIPCIWNNSIQGIVHGFINYSLSPEENCKAYDSVFLGFNIKNITIAEEKYKAVLPTCVTLKSGDITEEFLNSCLQLNKKEWKCENIIIRKK